jgi:hypothetical protein
MEPTEDGGYGNNRGRGPTPVAEAQKVHDQSFWWRVTARRLPLPKTRRPSTPAIRRSRAL